MHAARLQAGPFRLVQTADKGGLVPSSTLCPGQIWETVACFWPAELQEEACFVGVTTPSLGCRARSGRGCLLAASKIMSVFCGCSHVAIVEMALWQSQTSIPIHKLEITLFLVQLRCPNKSSGHSSCLSGQRQQGQRVLAELMWVHPPDLALGFARGIFYTAFSVQ